MASRNATASDDPLLTMCTTFNTFIASSARVRYAAASNRTPNHTPTKTNCKIN